MSSRPIQQRQFAFFVASFCLAVAACNITSVPDGGIIGSFQILGRTFNFSLGDVGPINVPANTPTLVPVGFRLFEDTPTVVPPSGVMRLPSSSVGVGQLLTKLAQAGQSADPLPLNGSGTMRFAIASGTSASLCASATPLAEFDVTYNSGVAAIVSEECALGPQALSTIITNDVTICIEITLDFDAVVTLSGFSFAFGGAAGQTAPFEMTNRDTQNIHILLPGESFDPAVNRVTPGQTRTQNVEVEDGEVVSVRAGRNGAVFATADCPEVTGSDYSAEIVWDGLTLTCAADQTDDGDDDEPDVPPGTIIEVPVDNAQGQAAAAPVTSTIGGVDYGVVGVLYAKTPLTNYAAPEPETMSVDLGDLGLAAVSTIHLAVHSSFVADLPNGVDLGTLTVYYAEGGAPTTLDFVLGSNTAEWSYDRPEHDGVPHSRASTLYTFSTNIDSASEYTARAYAVTLSVDATRTISCITLAIPDGATYAAYRAPGDPFATWASQYVGAMTFVGPAGTPATVGNCSAVAAGS